MCHCVDRQRRTGSLFGVAAFFERSAVTVANGRSKPFTRNSVIGKPVSFHFCPKCGSTVFWEPERMPHLIRRCGRCFRRSLFSAAGTIRFHDIQARLG